ncbi:MAG: DUF1294 domain-containing protein [Aureispira sp.]|nr:DUF1294 domain-containing protein [Aureispira sp.]
MLIFIIVGVFIVLNLGSFFLVGWDKRKATKEHWRIPEKRFYWLALLGGGSGLLMGMSTFRHKTQKWAFKWRLYLAIALNLALISVVIWAMLNYNSP